MEQPPTPDAMAPELHQQPVRKFSWKWTLIFLFLLIPIASSAFWAGRESVKQRIHPTITPTIQTKPTTSPTNSQQIGGLVQITSINPVSGPANTSVIITGSGFASTDNTVHFGTDIGSSYQGYSSSDGKTITFIVPTKDNPRCPDTIPRCPIRAPDPITPGIYDVSISNSSGTSNKVQFTVI